MINDQWSIINMFKEKLKKGRVRPRYLNIGIGIHSWGWIFLGPIRLLPPICGGNFRSCIGISIWVACPCRQHQFILVSLQSLTLGFKKIKVLWAHEMKMVKISEFEPLLHNSRIGFDESYLHWVECVISNTRWSSSWSCDDAPDMHEIPLKVHLLWELKNFSWSQQLKLQSFQTNRK